MLTALVSWSGKNNRKNEIKTDFRGTYETE